MNITCGGCTTTWTSLSACHCGACHRQFRNLAGFDAHRPGQCLDPATVGMVEQAGLWATPEGHQQREQLVERARNARAAR